RLGVALVDAAAGLEDGAAHDLLLERLEHLGGNPPLVLGGEKLGDLRLGGIEAGLGAPLSFPRNRHREDPPRCPPETPLPPGGSCRVSGQPPPPPGRRPRQPAARPAGPP